MIAADSPAERAARGARALDAVHPGWYRHVDLDVLDISRCHLCVLGQLYGGYIDGVGRASGLADDEAEHWVLWHGFESTSWGPDRDDDMAMLTVAWRDEIGQRRTPCPAPARTHAPDRRAIEDSWYREVPDPAATGPVAPEREVEPPVRERDHGLVALSERMIRRSNELTLQALQVNS